MKLKKPFPLTLAKAIWDALSVGDADVLNELMADDLLWHVPGNNAISGTRKGRDEVIDYLGSLGTETEVYDLELRDILVNDDRGLILFRAIGKRLDKTLDTHFMLLFQVEDNQIKEAWSNPFDQNAVDLFWS